MFSKTNMFNGDISSWDVSSVHDMGAMFKDAKSFNRDLLKWDTSSVIYMTEMFATAIKFNRDISRWDVSSATDMDSMFSGASMSTAGRCMTMNMNMNTGHTGFSGGMSAFTSTDKLKSAIEACLNMDRNGDCFNSQYGPMAHW